MEYECIKPALVKGWYVVNASEDGDVCMGQFSRKPTWHTGEEAVAIIGDEFWKNKTIQSMIEMDRSLSMCDITQTGVDL